MEHIAGPCAAHLCLLSTQPRAQQIWEKVVPDHTSWPISIYKLRKVTLKSSSVHGNLLENSRNGLKLALIMLETQHQGPGSPEQEWQSGQIWLKRSPGEPQQILSLSQSLLLSARGCILLFEPSDFPYFPTILRNKDKHIGAQSPTAPTFTHTSQSN